MHARDIFSSTDGDTSSTTTTTTTTFILTTTRALSSSSLRSPPPPGNDDQDIEFEILHMMIGVSRDSNSLLCFASTKAVDLIYLY